MKFIFVAALLAFSCLARSAPVGDVEPLSQVSESAWEIVLILCLVAGTIGFLLHTLLGQKRILGSAKVRAGADAIAPFHGPVIPLIRGACTALIGFVAILRPLLDHTQTGSSMTLNDNIGGAGTLVGVYVPVLLTLVSLVWGHFNHSEAAVKEVGIAILVNCLYLTFNLCKALATGLCGFSYVDVLVALLTIDASTIGISLTMSNKDVLASRVVCWLVSSHASRFFGCYGRNHRGIWPPLAKRRLALHAADMVDRDRLVSKRGRSSVGLLRVAVVPAIDRYKKISEHHKNYRIFHQYPATIVWFYVEEIPLLLVNLCSLLLLLRRLAPEGSSNILEWGQSATLITCVVAFVHWVYAYRAVITRAKAWITDRVLVHLPGPIGLPLPAQKLILFVVRCFARTRALLFPGMNATPWHTQKRWLAKEMAIATQLGDTEAIEELLSLGASVHHAPDGSSSLNEHAAPDLSRGPSLSFDRPESKTPLVTAIEYGHKHLVQLYLELGAPLDALDITGKSPLCCAIAARQFDVAHLLMDLGARMYAIRLSSVVLRTNDPYGGVDMLSGRTTVVSSALHHAVLAGDLVLVRRILSTLKNNADRDRAEHVSERCPLTECRANDVDGLDSTGCTALSLSIEQGSQEIITELLRHGAALHWYDDGTELTSERALNDFDKTTKVAVRENSTLTFINLCLWWHDKSTWLEQALECCIRRNRYALVEILLLYPIPERTLAQMLRIAHRSSKCAIMKLLCSVTRGPDGNGQDISALWYAVRALDLQSVKVLLQLGANPCQRQLTSGMSSKSTPRTRLHSEVASPLQFALWMHEGSDCLWNLCPDGEREKSMIVDAMLQSLDIARGEGIASKTEHLLVRQRDTDVQALLLKYGGRRVLSAGQCAARAEHKSLAHYYDGRLRSWEVFLPRELWALDIVVKQRAKTTDDLVSIQLALRTRGSAYDEAGLEYLPPYSCPTLDFPWSPQLELEVAKCRHLICRNIVQRTFWIEQRCAYFSHRPSLFQPLEEAELLHSIRLRVGHARAANLVKAAEHFFTERHGI